MTSTDEELMAKYGIRSKQETVYFYKQYRYDSLEAAVRYAKIDMERSKTNTTSNGKKS